MDKLGAIWSWLLIPSNTAILVLVGGAVATLAKGAWALYKHFSKPADTSDNQQVIINNINQNFPLEQFENLLKESNQEILKKIGQADPAQRLVLEKELAAIKAKHDNLQKAYEEHKVKLAEVYQALDQLKQEVPAGEIEQAREALARGETGAAETLYEQLLAKSTSEAEKRTKEAAEAAYQLGVLAESRIDYGKADQYYRQALQLQPDNSAYMNAAGNLSCRLGHYQESEQLLKRALELREQSLKPDDTALATSLNNLAVLYKTQGKYGEADPLYKRALAINEKALGPEDPNVAIMLNNLAELYKTQGKYTEAEPLMKRALAIDEKALGPAHPNVAIRLSNLADLYSNQGRYTETEPLMKRALAIDEKALGPEHPNVAIRLNNLAELYKTQGKYTEAEPLIKRALAIDEKALGPEHPNVAIRLNNLAGLYQSQGKYKEAEPLYQRALDIDEKALGPEHPSVATCLENYAALLKKMGREKEAEPLEARARAIRAQHAQKNPPK